MAEQGWLLRLGPRQSEDFDFFCDGSFQPSALLDAIAYLKNAELSQIQEDTLTAIVDREGPVKVSFFGAVGLNRVEDPDVVEENGIRVASMIDLVATKLKTVQQRALAKDYLDVASALDTGLGLPQALAAAGAIFGRGFNGALSLKALAYFEDGDLPTLRRESRDKLGRSEEPASFDGEIRRSTGRRAAMNESDELRRVAKRVVWFKPPEETLNEPTLFLAHVMTFGTLADIVTAMKFFSDDDFDRVLCDPPTGIFDIRSWNYWNLHFRHEPVPPLPSRNLPSTHDQRTSAA